MKKLLGVDVDATLTFNKTAGVITISNCLYPLSSVNMLLIVNATRNQIMLNFIDPSLSYTLSSTVSNRVYTHTLTFGYSTASMADSDVLQIYVDIEGIEDSLAAFLRRLIGLMESNAIVDSSGRQRVTVESGSAISVVNSTGFGPNVTGNTPGSATPYAAPTAIPVLTISEGPVDQRIRIQDATQMGYALSLRAQLSW